MPGFALIRFIFRCTNMVNIFHFLSGGVPFDQASTAPIGDGRIPPQFPVFSIVPVVKEDAVSFGLK